MGTCMVSQMFQNTKRESSVWFQRGSCFFLSLLACSSGIDSFPDTSVMFCSEDVCCAVLGFFGHQHLLLGLFFLNLRIQTCMLLCHSSVFLIWKGVEHVAHDLESSQAAAFSLELDSGVLRKCTLHCSAVARYPDWDTWASPVQT